MTTACASSSRLDKTPLRRFLAKLRSESIRALELYFDTYQVVVEAHASRTNGQKRTQ